MFSQGSPQLLCRQGFGQTEPSPANQSTIFRPKKNRHQTFRNPQQLNTLLLLGWLPQTTFLAQQLKNKPFQFHSGYHEPGAHITLRLVFQLKTVPFRVGTLAMTSGSGSSMGSAHSTVTTLPHTFTFPLISLRRAWAAVLWSSYSKKQKPLFFFLLSGWWYNITSLRPSGCKWHGGVGIRKGHHVNKAWDQ